MQVPGMMMNVSRMAQSQLHLLSLCCILTVDSHGCLTWALLHNKEYSRNCIPGSPFFSPSVLHLCPVVPMGSSGLGPTEQVQHINFSCNAESLFLHNQTPTPPHSLPGSIPPPPLSVPGGWFRRRAAQPHPVPLGTLGHKYCAASGTAGAITPCH